VSVAALMSIWQLIPDAWYSDGEGTFTELQSRPPGNKVIVAGRAVRSSARYRRRRFNQVLWVDAAHPLMV